MTLSSKHTRPITVEGTRYRWMLKETDYGARFELLIVIEAVDCPNGERLVAHLEADRRDDDSVTPHIVESLIKAGVTGGWAPARQGSCPALGHTLRDLLAERRAKLDAGESSAPLDCVRSELVRRFGRSIQVDEDPLSLRVRAGAELDVSISVDDPVRPSFVVSYPGFDSNAESWEELRELVSKGVQVDGVIWIVNAFVNDGAVLPEFPNPRLRRNSVHQPSRR